MKSDRPLFIPLRSQWFHAFREGRKRVEWRQWGRRWNRDVAHRGRAVVLSHGYSGARLLGTVVRTRRVPAHRAPAGARAIYPDARFLCAIQIELQHPTSSR